MILEASTIAGVQHARAFARHLYKSENEIVQVWESLSGSQEQTDFSSDLVDLQLLTNLTQGRTGIFHVAIAPRQFDQMEEEQWQRSMMVIEEEFELTDQMRLVMFHQKGGRKHIHAFWSLVDSERERLLQVGRYKRRLQRRATQLEKEFGHELTPRYAGERSIQISHAERMEKIVAGKDPKARKKLISQLWNEYDDPDLFRHHLQAKGYHLAQGERCRYAVVDRVGTVYNLVRQLPTVVKLRQTEERLADHYHELPSIVEVKRELQAARAWRQMQRQKQLDQTLEQIRQPQERKR